MLNRNNIAHFIRFAASTRQGDGQRRCLWICSCGAQDLHDGGWVTLFTSYAKHVDEIRIVDELITVKPEAEA